VIFFSSRVHPGESPGSWMLNGALEIITEYGFVSLMCYSPNNEQGKILRKNFVFKIVPMLNPDGVARGYYRLDTNAYNLNRFYLTPNRVSNRR
jgi:murein tripeptide amidase MpaA